jgi:hypothetical protein
MIATATGNSQAHLQNESLSTDEHKILIATLLSQNKYQSGATPKADRKEAPKREESEAMKKRRLRIAKQNAELYGIPEGEEEKQVEKVKLTVSQHKRYIAQLVSSAKCEQPGVIN